MQSFKKISLSVLLSGVLAAGTLSGCGLAPRPPGLARLPKGTPATKAKLDQVRVGMTVDEVVAVFGSQGHVPKDSSPKMSSMSWLNEDMTGAIVMFENGRVSQKTRVGALK